MSNIKDAAKEYEPPMAKNIAELEVVFATQPLIERRFKEGTEEEFSINVIVSEGEDYRVPNSVLSALKSIIEEKPDLKSFKVKKDGTGLKTRYTVIPLE